VAAEFRPIGFDSKAGEQEIIGCRGHYYPLALSKAVIQFTLDRGFVTLEELVGISFCAANPSWCRLRPSKADRLGEER
jgi:hypothetical protein